jgi:hypothetical protein
LIARGIYVFHSSAGKITCGPAPTTTGTTLRLRRPAPSQRNSTARRTPTQCGQHTSPSRPADPPAV